MKGDKIKPFYLFRKTDVHGISGTGIIGLGAVLPSGRCIFEWTASNHPTITLFQNLEEIELIHGHGDKTKIILGNPKMNRKKREKT